MTPTDLALAALLLLAAPGTPEIPPPPARWAAVQAALHATAVGWEVLDERETRYVLARPEDFEADLNLLRRRVVDLADAPALADADRLPDRGTIDARVRFNRAYRNTLDVRLAWEADRAAAIGAVARETDRLYRVWDLARDARAGFYYVTVRREAMRRLRDAVGPEAFDAGELPPCVPAAGFRVVPWAEFPAGRPGG